jgi:hypothetical protein
VLAVFLLFPSFEELSNSDKNVLDLGYPPSSQGYTKREPQSRSVSTGQELRTLCVCMKHFQGFFRSVHIIAPDFEPKQGLLAAHKWPPALGRASVDENEQQSPAAWLYPQCTIIVRLWKKHFVVQHP